MTKQTNPPLKIRIPPDVRIWLQEQAKHNARSQSGEVVFTLRSKMLETAVSSHLAEGFQPVPEGA